MSDICIFGGNGKIGIALSCFLKSLGYNIGVSDVITNNENIYSEHVWINTKPELLPNRYEAFVSCVPSIEISEQIRAEANKRKIKYFDFGGDIEHQDLIRSDFENCQHGVFTGIGLAPGYVNLTMSDSVKYLKSNENNKINTIVMYVGGIPEQRNENIFGWLPTWSIEGLLKSYKGQCRILENGNIINVKPLEYGYDQLSFTFGETVFALEVFANSGGISHSLYEMLDEGVKNCAYFTARWPGHVNTFKCIEKMCEKFNLTEVQKINFIKDITNTGGKDMVLIKGVVLYNSENNNKMLTFSASFNATNQFSAMQIATAMPAAAMIDFVIKNNLVDYITYKDIDYKEIENTMQILRNKNNMPILPGNTIIDACEESDNGF